MKTTAHYLKIFCLLVLPILSYACPALAVGSGNENGVVAGENKALKEKMVRFFLNYLSGDETLYQDNKPVSLADIARQRQLVWEAWVEANNRFDEQKLIGLGKLEQENSGNWDLPAELEPHAVIGDVRERPSLKGDTRFTSICMVPVIRARSGQPGSYFAKNSTMFLRPILYPRFPIWVIITAGGKNQNSLPGKSCYAWLLFPEISTPIKSIFSVYPKGDTVASVSPLIMPIIWPEQDLWPGENL